MKDIYFDTNIFIYLFEEKEPFASSILRFLEAQTNKIKVFTSVFALGELLVHPYRLKRFDIVELYKSKLDYFCEEIMDVDRGCIDIYSRIRAEFASVKPPDALHLACALARGLTFFTNDEQLLSLKVKDLKFQSLSQLR